MFKVGDRVTITVGVYENYTGVIDECFNRGCNIRLDDNNTISELYKHIRKAF